MNTKFLTVILILSVLLITADKSYACNDPPNADLYASPNPVCVGHSVSLYGTDSSDPDGEITKYEWDWTNDDSYDYSESPGDGIATHIYTDAETYTVKLRVTDDDGATDTDTCTVYVVKVNDVEEDKTLACVDEDITFTANSFPSDKSLGCIQWQKNYRQNSTDPWGNWVIASGGDNTAVLNTNTPGFYKYRARNGSDDSWKQSSVVTVVKVDIIQYDDTDNGYTNIEFPLFVRIGTTVTFKAIPLPSDASWPSGKPVWGGTSGASGSGETTDVTFSTLSSTLTDYKTVTAECGNTETADIVVFDFEGTFTPGDNFDDRSTEYYGIEELVALSFETDPWSVTAGQAGGLEWTKGSDSQPGSVSNVDIDYGTADYDAEESPGTVWLKLTIKSGPSKGSWEGYQKDVILPTGTRLTRVNPNNVYHIQYTASAGIKLYYWLDPKNVSFKYLTFGEGSCPSTNVSGFFLKNEPWLDWPPPTNSYPNGTQVAGHPPWTLGAILGGNITTGCRVSGPDYSCTGVADPWAAGSFTYVIPTEYGDDTTSRHQFGTKTKVATYDVNGKATNTKGLQSGEAALNDPSMIY